MLGQLTPFPESNDAVEHVTPSGPGPGWESEHPFRRFRKVQARQAGFSFAFPFLTGQYIGSRVMVHRVDVRAAFSFFFCTMRNFFTLSSAACSRWKAMTA